MKNFTENKGQSVVEFCAILPFFLLLTLGMAQLTLIFINYAMVKYAAYITVRSVVVRQADERLLCAEKTNAIAGYMFDAANNYSGDSADMTASTFKSMAAGKIIKFAGFNQQAVITETQFQNSVNSAFLSVIVSYNMPLKVPVVKNIFGMFQKNPVNYSAAYLGYPFYTIKASAVMRLE